MSCSHKPRKAYRPRPSARAAKPAQADREEVLGILQDAIKALREGVATELQWSIADGALEVSKAIEHQGIVRGLAEHLATTSTALLAIYDRAMATGTWRSTALWYYELDALQTFLDLHTFQVHQLGRAEFLAAVDGATNQVRRQGGNVTVVRGDLQEVAAA